MFKKGFVSRKDDILSLTKWIFVLSRIFGFWSFSVESIDINKKKSYIARMKIFDWCRAIAAISIYFLLMLLRFSIFGSFYGFDMSFLEIALNEMTVISSALMTILTIFMDIINREKLWKIIMTFNDLDEKVK